MRFTSLIVEDLKPAADHLRKHCERSGIIDLKGHFLCAENALEYLSGNLVDLVFLDVEMPGMSGFEMLDQLVYRPQVILTTSKTEYAYNAFEYKVCDFLKKPFSYDRFAEALQKVEVRKRQSEGEEEEQIFIKVDGKLVRLKYDDILFMESMGDYVKFVTADRKFITHNTMKNLEAKFSGQSFLKVHRSYIVNLNAIDDIQDNMLYIKGNQIPVSKAHKGAIIDRIHLL
jgi:DNA-binding LytR/AlgR family response regulator